MRHVSEDMLRARADRELTGTEAAVIEQHLACCRQCRVRAERIASRALEFDALFAAGPVSPAPDVGQAFTRFEARRREREQESPHRISFVSPRIWAAVGTFALAVLMVVSGPSRAAGRKLLGIFRAKTIVAVPLAQDFMAGGKGRLISDLLSDSTTITRDEAPHDVANRQEASEWAGFPVRLPAGQGRPRVFRVEGARSFHLKVDIKRLKEVLKLVDDRGLQLPPELPGAQVDAEIPRSVEAVYGECPDTPAAQADPSRMASCLQVIQSPSATITVQPDLDLQQVAGIGLQVIGMTASQAAEFNRTIDWASTAAIPLPREAASYRNIAVDGVQGILIVGRQYANWLTRWALIWVRDQRIYSLGGFGDPRRAVEVAGALQ